MSRVRRRRNYSLGMFEFEDDPQEPTPDGRRWDRAAAMSRSFLMMIGLAVVALAAAVFLVIWAVDVLGAQKGS